MTCPSLELCRAIASKADRRILPSEILNQRQRLLELLSVGGYEDKGAPCFGMIEIMNPGPSAYSGLARRLTFESAARYPVSIAVYPFRCVYQSMLDEVTEACCIQAAFMLRLILTRVRNVSLVAESLILPALLITLSNALLRKSCASLTL